MSIEHIPLSQLVPSPLRPKAPAKAATKKPAAKKAAKQASKAKATA